MEFSRQEYWSGLPCPTPGDLLEAGIEPGCPVLQADSLQILYTREARCFLHLAVYPGSDKGRAGRQAALSDGRPGSLSVPWDS